MPRQPISLGLLCLLYLLLLLPSLAHAHKPSDSYLRLAAGDSEGGTITGEWDIALKDLNFLLNLDADGDSRITWGELKAQRDAISTLALDHLEVAADARTIQLRVDDLLVNRHSDGTYATLILTGHTPPEADTLDLRYSLLFDADPTHRGLILFTRGDRTSTHILTTEDRAVQLTIADPASPPTSTAAFLAGLTQMTTELGHVLLVIALLLPAVLVRRDDRWEPAPTPLVAAAAAGVLAMFALAHSVTLWLGAVGWLQLPPPLIRAAVALSLLVAAGVNLYPRLPLPGWGWAFLFGLIHGLWLADAFSTLSPPLSLPAFHLGLELGLLTIALPWLLLAYPLRGSALYRRGILPLGSALILLLALLWAVPRGIGLHIPGV